jgi:hypothetical protein
MTAISPCERAQRKPRSFRRLGRAIGSEPGRRGEKAKARSCSGARDRRAAFCGPASRGGRAPLLGNHPALMPKLPPGGHTHYLSTPTSTPTSFNPRVRMTDCCRRAFCYVVSPYPHAPFPAFWILLCRLYVGCGTA